MLDFLPLTNKNIARVRACYRRCTYGLADYSVGMKLMWKGYFHSAVAFSCGCLIVKENFGGKVRFDYPVPETDDADVSAALCEIERYCMENYIPLAFYGVPQSKVGELAARYRSVRTKTSVNLDEYVYEAENMMSFAGKHYSGQRNHINKFRKLYPDATFRTLEKKDEKKIEEFFGRFEYNSEKTGKDAGAELRHSKTVLRRGFPWGCAGCIELDGKIIALSLGEICGDVMVIHIEKALHEYEGAYTTIVEEFARRFCGGVRYINREEDNGDAGLRRSKTQYRPKLRLRKYDVFVDTELRFWDRVPTIKTERLTLGAITSADIADYNRLCLDDERNKYWGYDYRADCPDPDEKYFLRVTEEDFFTRTAVNFAVRAGEKFAGEVVVYDFDYHGGAQIGVRILPEFDGRGYGKEAVAAVIDRMLYDPGLSVVYAKCHRENVKSFRMLSAVMEKAGEDETFRFFERRV